MITKAEALTADRFHENGCTRFVGSRGGVTEIVRVWRRNGRTQTWKTRPDEFRVPIKYGLYDYSDITQRTASEFHVVVDCPLNAEGGVA